MTWIFIIITVILLAILSSLDKTNRLKKRKLELELLEKEEAKYDELLKRRYSNLFYEMKDEIRDYHRELVESGEDVKYGVDTEGYVISWYGFVRRIKKEFLTEKTNKEAQDKLSEYIKFSKKFSRSLHEDKKATKHEANFVLYLVWGRLYEETLEIQEDIFEVVDDKIFEMWHEDYEDYFAEKS